MSSREALDELPFPQLLAYYIDCRNWDRRRQAERLQDIAIREEMAALRGGVKPHNAAQFVEWLRRDARRLLRPEGVAPFKPLREQVTPAQLAFYRPMEAAALAAGLPPPS